MDYSSDRKQAANEKPPVFRNMRIENVTGEGAPTAILIQGLEDSPVENIRFENLTIASTKGVVCSFARGLVFSHVVVTPAQGPVFDLTGATGIAIRKAVAPKGMDVFLKLAGPGSGEVRIEASDLTGAKQAFVLGEGVSAEAVKVKP
jgi:hypothetical protein